MKFHEVETALKEGRKIKMASWKNAYWYLNEKGQMINHFEEGKECPTALLFPQDVLWVMTGEWEIVAENAPVVTESPQEETFGFGEALAYLEQGAKVARKGWNGKGIFLFLATDIDFSTDADLSCVSHLEGELTLPAIVEKTADDKFNVGWTPSQIDFLAKDWYIV